MANQGSGSISIISTVSNTVTGTITAGLLATYGVSISPNGQYAYAVNPDGANVVIISTATNSVVGSVSGSFHEPFGVTFSPSGTYAYVMDIGGFPKVIDVVSASTNSISSSFTSGITNSLFAGGFGPLSAPTITLANAISPNSIDLIAGSASDNALITATCSLEDACQIDSLGGTQLASGTTTVALAYNTLPLGYSVVYANDINSGLISNYVYIRRITEANSLRLTFVYNQPTAEPANASILVEYKATKYNYLESNSLNNTAIAFKNGTVAYSWLEGNALGEENPSNQLIYSANVVYWLRAPVTNTFLPADTGTPTTNSLIFVFGSRSSNLLDGNFIGEAPQLSCPTGNASMCVGGTYAKYDNGRSIFLYYDNFAGNVLPSNSGWDIAETASLVLDNGISFTGAGTGGAAAQMTMNTPYARPISMDMLSEVLSMNALAPNDNNPVYDIGYVNTPGTFCNGYQVSGPGTNDFWIYVDTPCSTPHDISPVEYGNVVAYQWNPVTLGIGSVSIHDEVRYTPFASYNDTQYNDYYPFFGSWWTDKFVYLQWFRLRDSYDSNVSLSPPVITPPNPTQPNITFANASTSITVLAGSAADNSLITANCYAGDVCHIDNSAGTSLASNLSTAKLPYNALPLGTTILHANDSTVDFVSSSISIDRAASFTTATTTIGCGEFCGSGGSGVGTITATTTAVSDITTVSTTTSQATTVPQQRIQITVGPQSGTAPPLCNDFATGYNVTYTALGTTFQIGPGISNCFNMTAINATALDVNVSNSTKMLILAVNFSVNNRNVSVNATMNYPCSIASADVAPFILRNGDWMPIVPFDVNAAACAVTFAVPSDPVIALFDIAPNSPTVATTSVPSQQTSGNSDGILIWIVAIVIVALLLLLYYRRRKKN